MAPRPAGKAPPRPAGVVGPRPLLDRPPGDRFRAPEPEPRLDHPSAARSVAFGVLGWAIIVAGWLAFEGVLGLDWGMVVVAAVGGWAIGSLVGSGAWSGIPHPSSGRIRLFAGVLAGSAWLGGQIVVYLWTRVTLPESGLDLGSRIAATPFTAYLGGIIGPLDALEIVLLVTTAWWAAR